MQLPAVLQLQHERDACDVLAAEVETLKAELLSSRAEAEEAREKAATEAVSHFTSKLIFEPPRRSSLFDASIEVADLKPNLERKMTKSRR